MSSSTTAGTSGKTGTGSTDAVAPLYPPGSVQMSGGLGRTPITIGLKGEYFNLERYLRDVQRFAVLSQNQTGAHGRLMVIDGFTYEASDRVAWINSKIQKVGKSIFLKADLTASVYFAPPISAPTALGSSAGAPAAATPSSSSPATGAATVGGLQ